MGIQICLKVILGGSTFQMIRFVHTYNVQLLDICNKMERFCLLKIFLDLGFHNLRGFRLWTRILKYTGAFHKTSSVHSAHKSVTGEM